MTATVYNCTYNCLITYNYRIRIFFFTSSHSSEWLKLCLSLTGWMTPAPFWWKLRRRSCEPNVGLCVKHLDLVAVDLVIGVKGTEAVRPPSEHKHLCADHGGGVEVPPACRWALRAEDKQITHLGYCVRAYLTPALGATQNCLHSFEPQI